MSYSHPSPRNPMRPVHWRWDRARQIVEGGVPFNSRRDDAWVRRAERFFRAWSEASTDLDFARVADAHPEVYHAFHLHREGDRDRPEAAFRFGVEARILAGSSPAEVSERTGMHADDVEAFERVFFDVRDRLGRRDFVINQVVGPAIHRGLNCRDYDLLWKLFGYMRGPEVLDALIATFDGGPRRVEAGDVAAALAADQGFDLLRQATYAGKSLRILVETQSDVVGLYHELLKIEQAKGRGGSTGDAMLVQVQNFLNAADAYKVGPPARGEDPGPTAELDAHAYEPATADLVRAGLGGRVEVDPELAALQFPSTT